jgi:hypothetical protein
MYRSGTRGFPAAVLQSATDQDHGGRPPTPLSPPLALCRSPVLTGRDCRDERVSAGTPTRGPPGLQPTPNGRLSRRRRSRAIPVALIAPTFPRDCPRAHVRTDVRAACRLPADLDYDARADQVSPLGPFGAHAAPNRDPISDPAEGLAGRRKPMIPRVKARTAEESVTERPSRGSGAGRTATPPATSRPRRC